MAATGTRLRPHYALFAGLATAIGAALGAAAG
jgi:hypothetical protein